MQNEMRDRLVELIKECHKKENDIMFGENRPLEFDEWTGVYADRLIENGVIVPPCKVGDIVWFVCFGKIYSHKIKEFQISEFGGFACSSICFSFQDFGKTVFLTKEEAEQKQKGGADNG